MNRQHAIEVGQMFDAMTAEISALKAENEALKRDLAQAQGREQALLHINAKQQNTLTNLQTALALKSGVDHAIKQAKVPAVLPPLDTVTEELAKRLSPPVRTLQMPQAVDRRPIRANKEDRIAS